MRIEAKRVSWSDRVENILCKAQIAVGVDTLKKYAQRDAILLYGVYADGFLVGLIVARIDHTLDGLREFVVMYTCKAFDLPGFSFTAILSPLYDQLANGLRIRIHAERKGHERLLKENGYKYLESVYIKDF